VPTPVEPAGPVQLPRDLTLVGFSDSHEALADYIDDFHNVERLHSTNGYLSPVELELHTALLQEAA